MRARCLTGTLVLALLLGSRVSEAVTYSQQTDFTTTSESMDFNFEGLPLAAGSVSVQVGLYGDYDATNEYAEVWIDSVSQANHDGSATQQCNTTVENKTYTVGSSTVSDGNLFVRVRNSAAVNPSTCTAGPNRVVVTVTYTAYSSTLPDLVVASVTAPYTGSTASAGSTFTVRYSLRVFNVSISSASVTVEFDYCPSKSTTGCTQLGTQTVTGGFTVGTDQYHTSSSLTVPTSAAVSGGYIRVEVDSANVVTEASESNNAAYDWISVTTLPDLTLTLVQLPYTGSASKAGSTFTARYTVRNKASSSAVTQTFSVAYHYCPTSTYSSTACTSLGTSSVSTDVPSGGSVTLTSPSLTIPSTAAAGTRYIRAYVDSTSAVSESSETNNELMTAFTLTAGDGGVVPDGPRRDGPRTDAVEIDGAGRDGRARESGWSWPDHPAGDRGPGGEGGTSADEGGCVVAAPPGARPLALFALFALLALLGALRRRPRRR